MKCSSVWGVVAGWVLITSFKSGVAPPSIKMDAHSVPTNFHSLGHLFLSRHIEQIQNDEDIFCHHVPPRSRKWTLFRYV